MIRWTAIIAASAVTLASAPARAVPPAAQDIGVDERLGEPLPRDLTFTDSAARTVRLGDYLGQQPVVLVLAYVRCELLCSLVLRGISDAVRTSEHALGRDYRVVTVSIDPRDTPGDAAARRVGLLEAARQRPADPGWAFLVGEEPSIRALADSLGFRYRWDARTEQYAHPGVIFLISPGGAVNQYLYGVQYAGGTLDDAIAAAGRGQIAGSDDEGGLLRCFRFIPALRGYWATISRFFEAGALLIFLALGFGIAVLIRRERRR